MLIQTLSTVLMGQKLVWRHSIISPLTFDREMGAYQLERTKLLGLNLCPNLSGCVKLHQIVCYITPCIQVSIAGYCYRSVISRQDSTRFRPAACFRIVKLGSWQKPVSTRSFMCGVHSAMDSWHYHLWPLKISIRRERERACSTSVQNRKPARDVWEWRCNLQACAERLAMSRSAAKLNQLRVWQV